MWIRFCVRPRIDNITTQVKGASNAKRFEDFLLLPSRERHLLDNLRSMHKKRQRESSRPRLKSGEPRKNRRRDLGGLGSKQQLLNRLLGIIR